MGLTSAGDSEFVKGLDIYDSVYLYEDLGNISKLPGDRAVYVDVSGDGAVRPASTATTATASLTARRSE